MTLHPLDTLPFLLVCHISVSLFFSACFLAFKNSEQGKIYSGAVCKWTGKSVVFVGFPFWDPTGKQEKCSVPNLTPGSFGRSLPRTPYLSSTGVDFHLFSPGFDIRLSSLYFLWHHTFLRLQCLWGNLTRTSKRMISGFYLSVPTS